MKIPLLTQEITHGNLGLQMFLAQSLVYSQNLSTGYIKGDKWYVDGDVAGSGDGKTWEKAFKTLTEAVAVATDDDAIFVAPGKDYEEGEIRITQTHLKIIGSVGSTPQMPGTRLYNSAITTTSLMRIDADNVEIAGINFLIPNDSQATHGNNTGAALWISSPDWIEPDYPESGGVEYPAADSVKGTWIHHCTFQALSNYYGCGIQMAGHSVNNSVIENCHFSHGCMGIYLHTGSRNIIRNNQFNCMGGGGPTGINYYPTTTGSFGNQILNNTFNVYATVGAVGIRIVRSPSAGSVFIDGNSFAELFGSAGACISKTTNLVGTNYLDDTQINV